MFFPVHCQFDKIIRTCYQSYSMTTENTSSFGVGIPNADLQSWTYSSAINISGVPLWGELSVYGGGGYVANLDLNQQISLDIIQNLQNQGWIDRQTRAIVVEFLVYNPNVNIFTFVALVAEFHTAGGTVHYSNLYLMKAYSLGSSTAYYLLCGFALIVYYIYYIVLTLIRLCKQRKSFFKHVENWLNLSLIGIISVMIAAMVLRKLELTEIMAKMKENKNQFLEFPLAMAYNESYKYGVAFLNAVSFFKAMLLLRLNKRMSDLIITVTAAFPALTSFTMVFCLCLMAYTCLFHFWFMSYDKQYSTFPMALKTLFSISLGAFDLDPLLAVAPVAAPIIFLSYVMAMSFVLLNILVIILMDAHYEVESSINSNTMEQEVSAMVFHVISNKVKKAIFTTGKVM